jgi:hypothetical protein
LEHEDVSVLLDRVAANAAEGRFRFVVLMDRLDDRLKELISFVNRNSRFTIYGVELEFYRFEEHEIVMPKLYGAEAGTGSRADRTNRQTWDARKFFEHAAMTLTPEELTAVRTIYDYCVDRGVEIAWGTGRHGSFNPRFPRYHPRFAPVSIQGNGVLLVKLSWVREDAAASAMAARLAARLRDLLGSLLPSTILERDAYLPVTDRGSHAA